MGVTIIGQVGPRLVADGSNTEVRQIRDGGLAVADTHGRYAELTSRGQVYSVFTPLSGALMIAAYAAPPAAGAAVLLTVLNPLGSGVNFEIIRSYVNHVSAGTGAGAGAWAYCTAVQNASITLATNAIATNHFNPQITGKSKVWITPSGLTGGTVFQNTRLLPSAILAGAVITSATAGLAVTDEVAGDVVVPPGVAITIAPPSAGTAHTAAVGLTWAEIPILF
jgi:hypothetical protein